jgi:hypothetical protein
VISSPLRSKSSSLLSIQFHDETSISVMLAQPFASFLAVSTTTDPPKSSSTNRPLCVAIFTLTRDNVSNPLAPSWRMIPPLLTPKGIIEDAGLDSPQECYRCGWHYSILRPLKPRPTRDNCAIMMCPADWTPRLRSPISTDFMSLLA